MYTDNQKKFRKENLELWEKKLLYLFSGSIPVHYECNKIAQIDNILNTIGIVSLNHMLYPDCGGFDIVGCNISKLGGDLIEILTDSNLPNVCKPKRLTFDSIDSDPEWSYFRLELDRLDSSGFYSDKSVVVEELFEKCGNFEPFSEYPPDEYYRRILRVLCGTLLIIPKTCYYNHIPATYLGVHNKYDQKLFLDNMIKLKSSKEYNSFLHEIT